MPISAPLPRICGHVVEEPQLDLIRGLVARYPGLSRTELAVTACELLGWLRANSKPKTVECRVLLDTLEEQQRIVLPARRQKRAKRVALAIASEDRPAPMPIRGPLAAWGSLRLQALTVSSSAASDAR